MEILETCSCPFCGNDTWDCEHLVLDFGGGGEDGGVGLRAWGGLSSEDEIFEALSSLMAFAWGASQSPPEDEIAVRARLAAVAAPPLFPSDDWQDLMGQIAEEVMPDWHGIEGRDEFLSYQRLEGRDARDGSLLESAWISTLEVILEEIPDIKIGDCLVMSMTSGTYYLVWAENQELASANIAAAVSSLAANISEAVATASGRGAADG